MNIIDEVLAELPNFALYINARKLMDRLQSGELQALETLQRSVEGYLPKIRQGNVNPDFSTWELSAGNIPTALSIINEANPSITKVKLKTIALAMQVSLWLEQWRAETSATVEKKARGRKAQELFMKNGEKDEEYTQRKAQVHNRSAIS